MVDKKILIGRCARPSPINALQIPGYVEGIDVVHGLQFAVVSESDVVRRMRRPSTSAHRMENNIGSSGKRVGKNEFIMLLKSLFSRG
jgi:hypothetical protein